MIFPTLAPLASPVVLADAGPFGGAAGPPAVVAQSTLTVVVHRQAQQSARAAGVRLERLAECFEQLTAGAVEAVLAVIGRAPFDADEIANFVGAGASPPRRCSSSPTIRSRPPCSPVAAASHGDASSGSRCCGARQHSPRSCRIASPSSPRSIVGGSIDDRRRPLAGRRHRRSRGAADRTCRQPARRGDRARRIGAGRPRRPGRTARRWWRTRVASSCSSAPGSARSWRRSTRSASPAVSARSIRRVIGRSELGWWPSSPGPGPRTVHQRRRRRGDRRQLARVDVDHVRRRPQARRRRALDVGGRADRLPEAARQTDDPHR